MDKNVFGELCRFGSENTFYFGGSLNYSTFIRVDDIKAIKKRYIEEFSEGHAYFILGSIIERLLENMSISLARDYKYAVI